MNKKLAIGAAVTGIVAAAGTAIYKNKETIQGKFYQVKDSHFKKKDIVKDDNSINE